MGSDKASTLELINTSEIDNTLKQIACKVIEGERIYEEDALTLYEKGELGYVGTLANLIRENKHGKRVYFNRNFHIEPTNICVFTCNFCSYSRQYKNREKGWELSIDEMFDCVKAYDGKPVTEVHIVGGVHPKMDLMFFCDLIKRIKNHRPDLHIKAFTAIELEYMFRKAKVSVEEGLKMLKMNGMDSIPGGGAEIFDTDIRNTICADKATTEEWLNIHETAHRLGISSNATMLYGHLESYTHRVDHMKKLRKLQDNTKGFNTFIPLKFRNANNAMSEIKEVSVIEDLKNYAISRIYMDNFDHIKAYWPMIGRTTAQMSFSYGVDDIDGTIDDTTKIYSMAGAEEQHPIMTTYQIVELIKQAGCQPIERDTLYNVIQDYSNYNFEEDNVLA